MQGASCILSICPELLPLGLQRFCQCFCSLRSFHVGLHITSQHLMCSHVSHVRAVRTIRQLIQGDTLPN